MFTSALSGKSLIEADVHVCGLQVLLYHLKILQQTPWGILLKLVRCGAPPECGRSGPDLKLLWHPGLKVSCVFRSITVIIRLQYNLKSVLTSTAFHCYNDQSINSCRSHYWNISMDSSRMRHVQLTNTSCMETIQSSWRQESKKNTRNSKTVNDSTH